MKPQSQIRSRLAANKPHRRRTAAVSQAQPQYSPLKRLKTKPEQLAAELANLTPQTVAAFLQRHRWRLLLPTRTAAADALPPNSHAINPTTGEPTTLKVWKQPTALEAPREDVEHFWCAECHKLTRHVLADIIDAKTYESHPWYVCEPCRNRLMQKVRDKRAETGKRNEESTLLRWASLLSGMWTLLGRAEARQACEQIFAAERLAVWNENLQRWSGTLPLERSAIQIGAKGFTFRRRDLLDTVAWTILEASRRGFLRRCKNECKSPLFVASHSRQIYCAACGVEVRKATKRDWAAKDRETKRHQPAA